MNNNRAITVSQKIFPKLRFFEDCFRKMKLFSLFGLATAGKVSGDLTVTQEVTFTMTQAGQNLGDVKISLFGNAVQKTANNFWNGSKTNFCHIIVL